MSRPGFEQLVSLYRAIQFQAGRRDGELLVSSGDQAELLRAILDDYREFGLSLAPGQPETFAVGDTVRVRAEDPRIGQGLLADSFDDVLRFPGGRIRESRFFVIDQGCSSYDANPPALLLRYRQVLEFVRLLGESAAYLDKEGQELIFLVDGKFSVPVTYTAADLDAVDSGSLDALLGRFTQDTHREQKLEILAKGIHSAGASVERAKRFACLLGDLPALLKKFDEGYRLFAADFSYEKIRDQLEATRLEETAKIHKTFSDIQNQILSIPVATIVVATQLKQAQAWDSAFWVNSAILVGVWVFVILTAYVLNNQLQTLDVIGDEIARKKAKTLVEKYANVQDIVAATFPKLEERLATQRGAFKVVRGVVIVGLVLAHVMYVALTEPFRGFVITGWNCLSSF